MALAALFFYLIKKTTRLASGSNNIMSMVQFGSNNSSWIFTELPVLDVQIEDH